MLLNMSRVDESNKTGRIKLLFFIYKYLPSIKRFTGMRVEKEFKGVERVKYIIENCEKNYKKIVRFKCNVSK